jgi:hypothetical protein
MKHKLQYIALMVFCLAVFSCKKDNYEEPKSKLSGRFHYKGEAIHVQYDQVPFLLFQSGFGKVGPIGTNTDPRNPNNSLPSQFPALTQEGTYSHVLFDGEYKLVVAPGQGPFYWPQTGGKSDSISITVKGDTKRDIEVEPYYMIRTPQISKAGGNVTAAFKIEKIITDAARAKDIETATLFINKTQFVSGADNIGSTNIAGSAITDPNNISLSVTVPNISPAQNYVFARIGVKIAGVEDLIFSPVVKINL